MFLQNVCSQGTQTGGEDFFHTLRMNEEIPAGLQHAVHYHLTLSIHGCENTPKFVTVVSSDEATVFFVRLLCLMKFESFCRVAAPSTRCCMQILYPMSSILRRRPLQQVGQGKLYSLYVRHRRCCCCYCCCCRCDSWCWCSNAWSSNSWSADQDVLVSS